MKNLSILFLCLICCIAAFAQEHSPLSLVGRWPNGPCFAATIGGNIAYIGNGAAMDILDISQPNSPITMGQVITPSVVQDIHVVDHYAYIANAKAGLRIIDIAHPDSPKEVGFYDTAGYAYAIFVFENRAYIADDAAGLLILDVSQAISPKAIATLKTKDYARDVFVSGQYAYVADADSGLQIIDIYNPAAPVQKGGFDFENKFSVASVHVSGQFAYAATWGQNTNFYGGLHILDVSDATSPKQISFMRMPGDLGSSAVQVFVSDQYAYVAYVSDVGDGLAIIDVHDPRKPTLVNKINTENAHSVQVTGQNVCLGDGYGGFRIIEVSNPVLPKNIGHYDTQSWATSIVVRDNYAYVADFFDGLRIVDVGNHQWPHEIGFLNKSGLWARGIFVANNYAYVGSTYDGLHILDVKNPTSIIEIGAYPLLVWDVQVVNNYAFVADRDNGLIIIDISNPSSPIEISRFHTGGQGRGIFVTNNLAFIAARDAGLHIIDVHDPQAPSEVSVVNTNDFARGIFVSGDYAYLADGRAGLRIIDVSQPASPKQIGIFHTEGFINNVYVATKYAYVTDGWAGLRLIDVSNPAFPREVGFYQTGDYAQDVYVVNNLIYVADGYDGFYVLQNNLTNSVDGYSRPPAKFALHQNHPNPFNPSTTIRYAIAKPGHVTLKVFNLQGQEIATLVNENKPAGEYDVLWHPTNLPSGVYLYRLQAGDFSETQKLVLLR